MVIYRVDDVEKARAFMASPHVKGAWKKAGVLGQPEISFLDGD